MGLSEINTEFMFSDGLFIEKHHHDNFKWRERCDIRDEAEFVSAKKSLMKSFRECKAGKPLIILGIMRVWDGQKSLWMNHIGCIWTELLKSEFLIWMNSDWARHELWTR